MAGVVIVCLLSLIVIGGMIFHLFRSLKDGVLSINQNQILPDFTCRREKAPLFFWALVAVYSAAVVVLVAGLVNWIIIAWPA